MNAHIVKIAISPSNGVTTVAAHVTELILVGPAQIAMNQSL